MSGKATVGGWSKLTLESAAAGGSRSLWMLGFLLSASAHALPLAAIWLTSEGPSVSTGTAFAVDLVIVEAGDPSSGEADVPTSPQAAQVLEDRPAPSAEAAAEDASELPPPQPAAGEEETEQEAAAVEAEVSSATPAPQAKLLQPRQEKAALSAIEPMTAILPPPRPTPPAKLAGQVSSAKAPRAARAGQEKAASPMSEQLAVLPQTGSGTGTPGSLAARPLGGNPPPDYPIAARRRGIEGLVLLSVEVSPSGRAASIRIAESSGSRLLDEAAQRAVEQWRFSPARHAGLPVASFVEIPVRFRLLQ